MPIAITIPLTGNVELDTIKTKIEECECILLTDALWLQYLIIQGNMEQAVMCAEDLVANLDTAYEVQEDLKHIEMVG